MTKRSAYVTVRNNTSDQLLAVGVVHKYSDDYKHRGEWAAVQPGAAASPKLTVEYNTGAFTTGRDWWFVTWYSPDMKTIYYSDPKNFQGALNFLENIAPTAISMAASAVAGIATSESGPGAVAVATAIADAAKATTDPLFNSENTSGFKQHILRSDDENQVTEVVINSDRSITFKSKSGNSNTGSSSKASGA